MIRASLARDVEQRPRSVADLAQFTPPRHVALDDGGVAIDFWHLLIHVQETTRYVHVRYADERTSCT